MAAPIVDVSDLVATGSTSTPSSSSITIGGSNRVLYAIVMVADNTPASVTSVTWNGGGGEALTAYADSGVVQTFLRTYVYRKIAPTAATSTVSVVLGASQGQIGLLTVNVKDCDQTTPDGGVTFANGNGVTPNPTIAVTSAAGKLVLDFLQRVGSTQNVGAGQTQLGQGVFGAVDFAGSTEAGASSVTMSWTDGGGGTASLWEWVLGALSLNEVSGGGGGATSLPPFNRIARQAALLHR